MALARRVVEATSSELLPVAPPRGREPRPPSSEGLHVAREPSFVVLFFSSFLAIIFKSLNMRTEEAG